VLELRIQHRLRLGRGTAAALCGALVITGGGAALGASSSGGPSHAFGPARNHDCHVKGPLPDRGCTPGAVFVHATKAKVCTPGYSKSVRNVPASLKRAVYAEYGVVHHSRTTYEVDHLVSLELGGSNDEANLWPESALPKPGFHQKDTLENELHDLVCNGKMKLGTAQRRIARDWLAEYHRRGH
jgi:hypothetical protein